MRFLISIALTTIALIACGGGQHSKSTSDSVDSKPADISKSGDKSTKKTADVSKGGDKSTKKTANVSKGGDKSTKKTADVSKSGDKSTKKHEFKTLNTHTARSAHGVKKSKLKPTLTKTLIKFFIVYKNKGPIEGIVISLTAPDKKKYYTKETDAAGYSEVLVPAGQKYNLVYLSLGRRKISAAVPVDDNPNQTLKLTLRYKGYRPLNKKRPAARLVLKGIYFDTGKSTIKDKSFPRLNSVVEYMTHKKSSRIEISGYTDNVGNPKKNKKLSKGRANACRNYLIAMGIDGSRIKAVGHGDKSPIASNKTPEGRQKNRRIEAKEL
jgi:outer membrane protein OmpA-like peptidoglycan-associated protein